MKQFFIAAFLLVCVTAPALAAADHDLEQQLNQKYVGKTLILRQPVEKDSQRYDSSGKLLRGGQKGSWTLYGGMNIRKISLEPDRLRLEGRRMPFIYDPAKDAMSPVQDHGRSLKVEILLDHACASLKEATSILHRIFAISNQDLLDSVPIYWKPFIAKRTGLNWKDPAADLPPLAGSLKWHGKIPPGVAPPKAIHTPEPEYTDLARRERYQGVTVLTAIITVHGRAQELRIQRPLGMGLDEKAIEAVKSWKFKPAKKDGQPINTEMTLEISFNLYQDY